MNRTNVLSGNGYLVFVKQGESLDETITIPSDLQHRITLDWQAVFAFKQKSGDMELGEFIRENDEYKLWVLLNEDKDAETDSAVAEKIGDMAPVDIKDACLIQILNQEKYELLITDTKATNYFKYCRVLKEASGLFKNKCFVIVEYGNFSYLGRDWQVNETCAYNLADLPLDSREIFEVFYLKHFST